MYDEYPGDLQCMMNDPVLVCQEDVTNIEAQNVTHIDEVRWIYEFATGMYASVIRIAYCPYAVWLAP